MHDEIHISYENMAWLIDEGPEWGQWAASIRVGPWWDGTKPVIVLMPPTWLELTQHEFLWRVVNWWEPCADIWVSWTVKEDVGGCAVWMQRRADFILGSHHWWVWHSPIQDKSNVLRTTPNDWRYWGV